MDRTQMMVIAVKAAVVAIWYAVQAGAWLGLWRSYRQRGRLKHEDWLALLLTGFISLMYTMLFVRDVVELLNR